MSNAIEVKDGDLLRFIVDGEPKGLWMIIKSGRSSLKRYCVCDVHDSAVVGQHAAYDSTHAFYDDRWILIGNIKDLYREVFLNETNSD